MAGKPGNHIIALAVAALIIAAGVLVTMEYMRHPRLTPALRGRSVAQRNGCFACHGPGGTGGVPNPNSKSTGIPAWDGGNAMMYVQSETEIREWILIGHPRRLDAKYRADAAGAVARSNNTAAPPVSMPAYNGVIREKDLEDLIAYYKAVAVYESMPKNVGDGHAVAARYGCFGCHGPGGRVGARNPGSFKGYIPPWQGDDFSELVKNDQELRRWILDGSIDRIDSNRIARFFVRRQVIKMPAYRDIMREDELTTLVSYINWLQTIR